MLIIKELPDEAMLKRLGEHYPDLETAALWPFVTILKAAAAMEQALDALLAEHGLQQGRWITLVLLLRSGRPYLTASELADQSGVTPATMTTFLDGLERKRLICRKDCTSDRRKTHIYLTPAGKKLLDAIMPGYYQAVSRMMKPLTRAERTTLMALLGKVQKGVPLFTEAAP